MATRPFDRAVINPRERPTSLDTNQGFSNVHATIMDLLLRIFSSRNSLGDDSPQAFGLGGLQAGFLGSGYKVRARGTPAMFVTVSAGLGMLSNAADAVTTINGANGVDDVSQLHPLFVFNNFDIPVPTAPAAGNERYDIVEVLTDRRVEQPSLRDVLNLATGAFDPTTVNKVLAYDQTSRYSNVVAPAPSTAGIGYKAGVTAAVGTAVVPAATSGYTTVAIVYVGPAVASITQNAIQDRRAIVWPYNVGSMAAVVQATAGTPATAVSVTRASASPGVQVTAIPVGGTDARVRVYVFMGAVPNVAIPSVAALAQAQSAIGAFQYSDMTSTTITAADQAALAAATPAVQVAVGQPVMTFTFTPAGAAGAQLYSVALEFSR